MKNNSQSKILKPLSLIFLLLIYLLLCSQFILKQVSELEASNYLNYFQLSANEQTPSVPYRSFPPNNIYFGSLNLWTQVFGTTLTSFRSFSILCGAFIIFILFFILKNKLDTKNTLSIISISTLNPVFIHFATNFDSVMELLLGMSILYLIMILLYRLKLQELISFRHRRHIVNWRSIVLSDSPPSRAKNIFTLTSSIFATITVVSTLLVGLKQDISIRKIFTTIYQPDRSKQAQPGHSEQIETPQSNQANQSEKSTPVVYILKTPSKSIYVENLLVAKELNKVPLSLSWQDALDKSISTKNLPAKFWIISFEDQQIDDLKKFLSDQNSSKTESEKKDPVSYQETETLKFDDISAKYFNFVKGVK